MYLLVLGIAPSAAILIYFYYRDRYEKEPGKLLAIMFALGGGAIVPAALIESLLGLNGHEKSGMWNALYYAFIGAALVEESLKYLILRWCIWGNSHFNQLFDGIVYSIFVSLGFATVENLLYIFSYGTAIGFMRALSAIPGHALYAVTMGYYLGLARFTVRKRKRRLYLLYSLLIPLILHGLYDFLLLTRIRLMLILLLSYMIYLLTDGIKKTNMLAGVSPKK